MRHNGDFDSYYLRRIGVAAPVADALTRGGMVSSPAAPAVLSAFPEASSPPAPGPVIATLSDSDSTDRPASGSLPDDLAGLRAAAAECTACALSQSRRQVVFGVGNEHPDVLFIGEAPGENEDAQGEPFVGKSGQMLERMLRALGWSREDNVYIMNVIKCRPPRNRDPLPEEVEACSHWFDTQCGMLRPKAVCLLGRVAAQRVLGTDATLASLRGRWHEYRGLPVLVTYHPSYLLRTSTGKAAAWQDMQELARRVGGTSSGG